MPLHTPSEIDAANRYHSYRKGWQHGAATRAMGPEFTGHVDDGIREAYLLGYQDGRSELAKALQTAQQRYGHTPTVLRTQDDQTAPGGTS